VAARDLQVELGMAAYQAGDYAEAAKSLKDSAIMGDPEAQFMLGRMFYEGQFFKQDYVEAAKWYRKAAEQGEEYGLLFLGEMYDNGVGVKQNKAKAKELFKKSCKQGLESACKVLKSYK